MEIRTNILFDIANNCVVLTFDGYIANELYRQGFNNIIELFIKNKDDLNWLLEVWLPNVKEQIAIKRKLPINIAIIHSKNVFADLTSQRAAKMAVEKIWI